MRARPRRASVDLGEQFMRLANGMVEQTDWDKFRDATRFAQNPEALGAVNASSLGRWQRDLDASDRRTFKRIAGPLLVELGYAKDDAW